MEDTARIDRRVHPAAPMVGRVDAEGDEPARERQRKQPRKQRPGPKPSPAPRTGATHAAREQLDRYI